MDQRKQRALGITAMVVVLLLSGASAMVYQEGPEPWTVVLGWPFIAMLQAGEEVREGGNIHRLLIQISFFGVAGFFLCAYSLWPRRATLFLGLVTLGASLLFGLSLAYLTHVMSDWDFF